MNWLTAKLPKLSVASISARMAARDGLDRQIFADRIAFLYQNSAQPVSWIAVMAAATAVTFWGSAETFSLIRWLVLVLATVFVRAYCIRRYFETEGEAGPFFWAGIFMFSAAVTGIAWGGLIAVAPPEAGEIHYLALIYIVGVCAASTIYSPYFWPITASFILGALGPWVALDFAQGSGAYTAISAGIVVLSGGLVLLARNLHLPFSKLIVLQRQNDDLVSSLRAEQGRTYLALEQAKLSEERAKALTDKSPIGIFQTSAKGEFIYANPSMLALLEIDDLIEASSLTIEDFLTAKSKERVRKHPVDLDSGESTNQEADLVGRRSGRIRHVIICWSKLRSTKGEPQRIATVLDITERRRAEMTVRHMSHHDALTGLINRTEFHNRLETSIAHAGRHEKLLGVLLVDIKDFRGLNESVGRKTADKVLHEFGERLQHTGRRTDVVARLGSDEFGVLSTHHKHEDGVMIHVERIVDAMAKPFASLPPDVKIEPRIGISIYPIDDVSSDKLMQNATFALKKAKEGGAESYQLYDQDLHARTQKRLSLEREIKRGLERGEFQLHYQPQISLRDGSLLGVEALIRWQHPERGLVMPGDFIPVAESSRLINPLSEWVIHAACAQAKSWQKSKFSPFFVSVNVSPLHFASGDLAETVEIALRRTGLDARWLDLEVTEGIVMTGAPQTVATMTRLEKLGVSLSIDDFGTGYSSLSYLKRYPFHRLKIDRSFISGLGKDRSDEAIVEAITRLGQSLGVTLLAEGVETMEEHLCLRALGCDEAQGYFYGRPMPSGSLRDWLEAHDKRRAEEDLFHSV